MSIIIAHENMFRTMFRDGINLFLGAGFSVLAKDCDSQTIPVGKNLTNEIRHHFNMEELDSLSLPRLCTIAETKNKAQFRQYLDKRFTVKYFDEKYNILTKCNIKSIFTTNIDDLIHKIFISSEQSYINDITQQGSVLADKYAITYAPLHGSILNKNESLIFSSVDVASSFSLDRDKWYFLTNRLQEYPTLFWGCNLDDADLLQALNPETIKGREHKPKWILIKEGNKVEVQYFEALGFYTIIGDTEQLLDYISKNCMPEVSQKTSLILPTKEMFPQERIPTRAEVPVRPLLDFYRGADPSWYDIFSGQLHKTLHFAELTDQIYAEKNVIVIGMPVSGKTTLMMQVASEIAIKKHKLVGKLLSLEKAYLIIKKLNGQKAIIFVDNFTDSLDAFYALAQNKNIQLIGFDREYNFDIASHKISRDYFSILDVTELSDIDAQKLFSKIPLDIRARTYTKPQTEKGATLSLYEMVESNIYQPNLRSRFRGVLDEIERQDYLLHDFFVMCCYVHSCHTPVSYDMSYAFLRDEIASYQDVYDICGKLGALLSEYSGTLVDTTDQDFFTPRSTMVSEAVMHEVKDQGLKRAILRFHKEVSPYRICNYDVFKTRAFDKDIMKKAFSEWKEGMDFYESIYRRDKSPYLLQQGALYLSNKHRDTEAFAWIDLAITKTGGKVFSIRNSHAIILFRANINADSKDDTVAKTLKQSMDILAHCYHDDKRKTYHALTFADHSIKYWEVYGDDTAKKYLETAEQWLTSEEKLSPWSRNIRELHRIIKNKLHQIG